MLVDVAQLIAGLLETHDRTRFEIYAFSAGPPSHGALRMRIERAVDHFVEVAALQDAACAERISALSIDIVGVGKATSDVAGAFRIDRLPAGSYRAAISSPSDNTLPSRTVDGIRIEAGKETTLQDPSIYSTF